MGNAGTEMRGQTELTPVIAPGGQYRHYKQYGALPSFPAFLKGDRQSGCILNTVPHMHFGSPPYSVVP